VTTPETPSRLLTAGIDIGSAVIKIAVMETDEHTLERVVASRVERIRRRDPLPLTADLFESATAEAGVGVDDLAYVATTGEGEAITFRTGHFYGMTTHARGGLFLDPEARTVLDIGALHTRAVAMDEHGKVLAYRMTSQCASGSGQFLENIARYLGVSLEEVGALSLEADNPEVCSSICAVLAETDVINMVSRGITLPNILKGIHASMASRAVRLVLSLRRPGVMLVTGGLAADRGLVAAMQEASADQKVAIEVRQDERSILAGAIGAALWGAFRARRLARRREAS
jgi:benzoyl-CoA reductase subunit D